MYVILSSSRLCDVDIGVSKWYLNPTGENLERYKYKQFEVFS